jgi:Uma2 family endonuclease
MNTTLDRPLPVGIPTSRIVQHPEPGTATIDDVIRLLHHEDRLCELIDGTLVEKPMGTRESFLAIFIARRLGAHAELHDLGIVGGADGAFRMLRDNIRYPDVSFVPWDALPDDEVPDEAIWSVVPTLTVEVLSESNTHAEMVQKWGELSELGTQVMWLVDPATRTGEVWRPGQDVIEVAINGVLDASPALTGFTLPLADVFASLTRRKKR